MIFFSILQFAASSIFWGILMAVAMVGLFIFIVRGWWKDALFTVWTYVTGVVLAILLAFQCILMVGALKIKSSCDEYEQMLTEIVDSRYRPGEIVPKEASIEMFGEIMDEYPLIRNYLGAIYGASIEGSGYIWGEGYAARDLPHGLIDYLRELLNAFIWRRVLWALGFAIVLGIIAILTIKKQSNSNIRQRNTDRLDRRGSSRTSERVGRDLRRVSHRR
jgi:amino acid transporter